MAEKDIKTPLGSTKSESRYISDRVDVQAARRKKLEAEKALSLAQRGFAATPSSSKVYQASADAVKARQAQLDEAKIALDRIEAAAKVDYQKAYKKVSAKKDIAEAKTIDQQIEVERQALQRLIDSGQSTKSQELKIQDLVDKKNKTGKYAPKPSDNPEGTAAGDQSANVKLRNYSQEVKESIPLLRKMSDAERKDLADQLKAAGFYNGPSVGIYTDALAEAYQNSILSNQARSTAFGEEVSWTKFIQDKANETAALRAGEGGKGTTPSGTVSISTPTEAAAKVEAIFKSEIGRLPTAEEREKYSAELIAREKQDSAITKVTPKTIGGVTVNVYTGGFDKDQFLKDKIRKLPEYNESKVAARTLNVQDLAKTALANGLDLNKNFGADTVTNWVKRVEAGEDIDIFKNLIRKTAATGLPDNLVKLVDSGVDLDAIYAPYKRTMASILEVPENSISLDDATLRGAIGPDKAMTLFDFQKQLRKDARWQYTDQAREEVSTAALNILRDFGFQG
jgi:hypothetical protein